MHRLTFLVFCLLFRGEPKLIHFQIDVLFLFQQLFNGFREREIIHLHDEVNHVTTLSASKTMPEVLGGIDTKGRCVLIVERT